MGVSVEEPPPNPLLSTGSCLACGGASDISASNRSLRDRAGTEAGPHGLTVGGGRSLQLI